MVIQKKNQVYTYFEVIEKLEPESILDMGMFLKRTGSLSRQVMNKKISTDVRLDGVDLFPQMSFPVWENIYDNILTLQEFLDSSKKMHYNLGVLFGCEPLIHSDVLEVIFERMKRDCDYLLMDCNMEDENAQVMRIEGDVYYFVDNN